MLRALFLTLACLMSVPALAAGQFFEGVVLVEAENTRGGAMGGGMGMAPAAAPPAAPGRTTVPVQFYMPYERKSDIALVLVPGGALSSWSYTTTPDGRDGWAQQFASAGIPVYLLNPPTGAREQLGRWNKESVWSLWGIGPEYGTPYEDSKFPVDAIDALQSSFHIVRAGGGTAHVLALLDEIGPAVVMGHSAGGAATFGAARAGHDNLRGTIAIETTNCPSEEQQLGDIYLDGDRAFLSVWGDNLDRGAPSMLSRYESCRKASEVIAGLGGKATTWRLPQDKGIRGNTHLMMQDLNNEEIGRLVLEWLADAF